MEAPCEGVLSGTGLVTVAITLDKKPKSRRKFCVNMSQGRIDSAMASFEETDSELQTFAESSAEMSRGSIQHVLGWSGNGVRAVARGDRWSNRLLAWEKGPVSLKGFQMLGVDEFALPFGCFVATCHVCEAKTGALQLILGVVESNSAKVLIWSHTEEGQPVEVCLATLKPSQD